MHFRGIDFPDALLNAQKENMLVVFAGAGVSMSPPANYPSFEGLARQIADGTLPLQKNAPLDRFLGQLKARGTAVHQRAHDILNTPDSRPTPLHYDLLRLFPSASDVQLVTTNFDLHFTTAATSVFSNPIEIFCAPALPLGHQFHGIVYLHGSVSKEPESLILTDDDFGRAYLTEGWARRFLQAMFSKYTVLFVGYSHNDVVMNYLARGLPPVASAPRFAFTSEPERDADRWHFLGITPLCYPLKRKPKKHRILGEAITDWVSYAALGILDHEQQIRTIVESPPPLDRETTDRIERALQDRTTTQFFTRHAKMPEWLRWAETKGPFKSLFQVEGALDPIAIELAAWFAKTYVCQYPGIALSVVHCQGQICHPILWDAIARELAFCQPTLAPEILAAWVTVLLRSPPARSDLLSSVLRRCQPQDYTAAILLFEHLTQPYLNLKPNFLPPDAEGSQNPGVELAIRGNHYWLKDAWQRLFQPHLHVFAAKLVPILTYHIQQAHLLLRAAGKADDRWDPFSYGRSAIESHPQDRYGEGPEILIDAARDVIEWMLAHTPERARTVLDTWRDSNIRVLQRLSIHGVTESSLLSADEKLTWIQRQNWLYTTELKHEVFRLLTRAYPQASEAHRLAILERVSQGPDGPDAEGLNEESRQYLTYQLLSWLHTAAPACAFAAEKFERMQLAHPDFQPREHPDLIHWWSLTVGGPESPTTLEELLQKQPEAEADWLLNYRGGNIAEATATSFAWSWKLVQVLRSRAAWSSELWTHILSGWYNSQLTEDQWTGVLRFLTDHPELYTPAHSIADLLRNGVIKEQGRIPLACLPLAQTVAEALWDAHPGEAFSDGPDVEWFGKAINHPGGKLVEFWLSALSHQRLQAQENGTGIPDEPKRFFHKVLTEPTPTAQLGRVILASRLYFLFTLEADWTRARILPLLDWAPDTVRAEQAWHGFLTWGQWNETLLADLMPFYQKTYAHIGQLGKLRRQFSSHLADIALFSLHHPLQGAWFDKFLLTAPPEDRKNWAGHIRHRLGSLREDAVANVWERWMKRYWDRRIRGIPIRIDQGELEEMAEWSLHLRSLFPQAVEKICRSPALPLENHLYYQLAETNYATTYPEALTRLLRHLLPAAQQPFYERDYAEKLVRDLIESPAQIQDLEQLCDELARLGSPHAAEIRKLLRSRKTKDKPSHGKNRQISGDGVQHTQQ